VHDLKVPGKARHEYTKGVERLHKNDAQGSLEHFKEATNAFPNYYEAYYQIGLANLELRRGNEAEQALQRSIDLSEADTRSRSLRWERCCATGSRTRKRSVCCAERSMWTPTPGRDISSWARRCLAEQVGGGGEERARSPAEKSDVPSTYVLLANIHIRRHEYISGIKDLDTFLSMKPQGPTSDQAREVRAAAQKIAARLEHTVTVPQFVY